MRRARSLSSTRARAEHVPRARSLAHVNLSISLLASDVKYNPVVKHMEANNFIFVVDHLLCLIKCTFDILQVESLGPIYNFSSTLDAT